MIARRLALGCAALAGCVQAPAPPFVAASSPPPHVLFVQLAGEVLQGAGSDDATSDHSGVALEAPSGVAYVPPFDPDVVAPGIAATDVADVLFDRIRTAFAPYDVTLTRTRPGSGAYTMIAIGGSTALVGANDGVAGIAYGVDCADANPSNVVYDFSDDQSPGFGGVVAVAATAAHEAGHAYGLQHTDDVRDLMYVVAAPTPTVTDVFAASFRETGAYSPFGAGGLSMPESCGRADPVNAGVLTSNLGASARSDTTRPVLAVSAPAAGADVTTMAEVDATASDDVGVVRIEVYKNFALMAVAQGSSIATQIDAANGETYYLTVEAIDAAANRASVTRLVTAHGQAGDDLGAPPDASAPADSGADAAMTPPSSGGCSYAATSTHTFTFTFAFAFAFAFTGWRRAARNRRTQRATRC